MPVVIGEAAGGARRLAASRGRRLSRRRDPPADRAGRHRAAAALVQRGASRRRDRPPRRHRPHPHPPQHMSAIFVTATGTDIGKTFVAAGLIRHWRAAGRTRRGVEAGGDRLRSRRRRGERSRRAARRARPPGHASRNRAHRALAFCRAAVARHGGAAREPRHRFRRAGGFLARRRSRAPKARC